MVSSSLSEAGPLLAQLPPDVKVSVSDSEFLVRLPKPNLIAGGATFDDALRELIEIAAERERLAR